MGLGRVYYPESPRMSFSAKEIVDARFVKELEDGGVMMPVLENKSKFLSPALYDDALRIVTIIRQKPTVRITFEYEIYNSSNQLIHQGETLLAFVNKQTGKPCRPPGNFQDVLKPYFE